MVIDFYATWCGPCLLMSKELEKVAGELGEAVRIVKLDVDANPDIASQVRKERKERRGAAVRFLLSQPCAPGKKPHDFFFFSLF